MTSRELAHEATRQIQRYGSWMPSTETMEAIIERAIDAACEELTRRHEQEKDDRRESLAQEIRIGLKQRGHWAPVVASDLISAVFVALDKERAAVADAVAAEREACAKVVEDEEVETYSFGGTTHDDGARTLGNATRAIRARSSVKL